jgi:ABC-type lipoprotein release transport system permease subunit
MYTFFMHLLQYLHFVWKTLWRKRSRIVLTILSISLAVMSLLFFFGLRRGYTQSMSKSISNFGAHLIAMPKGCPYEASSVILQGGILPKQLPDETLDRVREISTVEHAYAMLTGMIPSHTTKGELDRVIGVSTGVETIKKNWSDISSTDLEKFYSSHTYTFVGSKKAESLNVDVGDLFSLGSKDQLVEVLAILPTLDNQDDSTIFIPLALAQELLQQQGSISSISVTVKDFSYIESTITQIESIEDVQVITMNELLQMVLEYIEMLQWLILGILLIAMLTSFIQIANTMTISVTDQMKEIVVLKAFGATNSQISLWIVLQSLLLGFMSIGLGVLITYICIPLYEYIVQFFLPLNQAGPLFYLTLYDISIAFVITISVTILACLYPLYLAMKEPPASAFAKKAL